MVDTGFHGTILKKHLLKSGLRVGVSQGRLPERGDFHLYPKGIMKSEKRIFQTERIASTKTHGILEAILYGKRLG